MTTAVTIGNFDGVHLGHAALVQRCRALVGPMGRVVVLTFDPHPLTLLCPARVPERLTALERRAALLRELGADHVEVLLPTPEFLGLEPDEFVNWLLRSFEPSFIVEGEDFHFGRGGRGTNKTLQLLSSRPGFATYQSIVVPPVEVSLSDQSIVRCSSSLLRFLVVQGRTTDAGTMQGRPYEVTGTVVQGDQLGRTIGFPTINIETQCLYPADGVYAATIVTPDNTRLAAAANVGSRPTVKGVQRRIEAHATGSVLPFEYNWPVRLEFGAFLRDQVRFDGLERLTAQLRRDCARAAVLQGRA
jgi:riboflavin kinase/FMN adenylyltransferase